ncbi:hypothetical protein OF381_10545 [Mannheimia haemolytica]
MVYLAMYKAKGNWVDKVIRLFTGKPYSHCELVIPYITGTGLFSCFTSSPRDGGVREKIMPLEKDKWDLIPLPTISEEVVKQHYSKDKGKKYDFIGAIGVVIGTPENPRWYFCSEWCYKVIYGTHKGAKLSPNELARKARIANLS